MNRPALTKRQNQVYQFVVEKFTSGKPATIREIGERFKIKSPNGVMCHLRALAKKGYIEPGNGRSGVIVKSTEQETGTCVESGSTVVVGNIKIRVEIVKVGLIDLAITHPSHVGVESFPPAEEKPQARACGIVSGRKESHVGVIT